MANLLEVLDANSIPEPNSGCWIWLRGVGGGGYPIWTWEGRRRQATHLALAVKGIEVPPGHDACHRCDNPCCVNPDHLFVGTRLDNMRDALAKRRLVGYRKREYCKRGHQLIGDNVYVYQKTGKRACQACRRQWGREYDARRR